MNKKLIFILVVACLFVFGFNTSSSNRNVYLQNNESAYIVRHDGEVSVYVYRFNPVDGSYTGQWIENLFAFRNTITVHFVEYPQQTLDIGGKTYGMEKSK